MSDQIVCPYCRMKFDEQSPPKIFCTACGMPHHEDCYQENGGCTVFGCPKAPADDPKLHVSYTDLQIPATTQAVAYQARVTAPAVQYPSRYGSGPLGLTSPAGSNPVPANANGTTAAASAPATTYGARLSHPKSRTTFILLGVLLGAMGAHNFYAGYIVRGACQLALCVLAIFSPAIVSWLWFPVICVAWIWAIVEICVVNNDFAGIEFS